MHLKEIQTQTSWKTQRIKTAAADAIFNFFNYLFFIVFTLMCIFPFYYLFINTISDNELVQRGLINFYPRGIHIQNYIALRSVADLGSAFIVTISRTIIGTGIMVAASGFVGYIMTKKEMWGRKFWYRFMIITMYFNAGIIPAFMTMQMLGLNNNYLVYIIPGIVSPYNIILVKTYIESIPAELEESAAVDGASYWIIFTRIIWPLSKPILATIAIFGAVGHWNSLQDSLIFMQAQPKFFTLQHVLWNYLNRTTNLGSLMSAGGRQLTEAMRASLFNQKVIKYTISMVSVIPILLVYPFMQRYFEEGIMLGAVKG